MLLGSASIAAAVSGCGVGSSSAFTAGEAEPSSVDIGFCTDMAFHHQQALGRRQRVLGWDTGEPVQAVASEIPQDLS